jgi:hypothetical protein
LSGVSVRRELRRPSGPDSGPAGVRRNALTRRYQCASGTMPSVADGAVRQTGVTPRSWRRSSAAGSNPTGC